MIEQFNLMIKNKHLRSEISIKNMKIDLLQHEVKSLNKQIEFLVAALEAIHNIKKGE